MSIEIDVTVKKNFKPGMIVEIEVEKSEDNRGTKNVLRGRLLKVLSNGNQKRGIKVELTTGEKGRVVHVPTRDEIKLENFKFFNQFFYLPHIYSIWNKQERRYYTLSYPHGANTEETVFLFEAKAEAERLMKDLHLSPQDYMVKEINRRKAIYENFKTLDVDVFRINRDRRMSYEQFNQLEHYFKSM